MNIVQESFQTRSLQGQKAHDGTATGVNGSRRDRYLCGNAG